MQCCTSLTQQSCDQGGENDFFLNTCGDSNSSIDIDIKYCTEFLKDTGYNSNFYKPQDAVIRYGIVYNATSNIIFSLVYHLYKQKKIFFTILFGIFHCKLIIVLHLKIKKRNVSFSHNLETVSWIHGLVVVFMKIHLVLWMR